MKISISSKKITVNDRFTERVKKKLSKFDRFFDEDATANVMVSRENDRETVEITVKANGMMFRAERSSKNKFDSLEGVTDTLLTLAKR